MAVQQGVEQSLAVVIPINIKRGRTPSCYICVKAAFDDDDDQTICTVVGEVIDTENITALDCETYIEDKDAT